MSSPTKKESAVRILNLRELIEKARYEYHVLNNDWVHPDVCDAWKHELAQLEAKYPDLITPDSPTQRVQSDIQKGPRKLVKHPGPMLSLCDVFTEKEVIKWAADMEKYM